MDIDIDIVKEYMKYKKSKTENVVSFVAKNIKHTNRSWIEILSCRYIKEDDYLFSFYNFSEIDENNRFKSVTYRLYPRTIQPNYPEYEIEDEDKRVYCNALTWFTANKDIEEQKKNGKNGFYWKISLVEPGFYIYKHWKELREYVEWSKVPKELREQLHDDDIRKKNETRKKILESYSIKKDILKNNPVQYFCSRKK